MQAWMRKYLKLGITSVLAVALLGIAYGERSVYEVRMEDPKAVYLEPGRDGFDDDADVTEALQAAINKVEAQGVFGIVFIPSGEYRLTDTIYIWKGVRLIGYGLTRPVFILPESTPGYAETKPKYLFHFSSNRPKHGEPIRDANPGTFYSAMTNIDIHLEARNPWAVAVRSHFAQHCFISNVRFEIGDALAGIDEVGNIVHDCEFIGGRYGIMTRKPSPSWPFALLDSQFRDQSESAILTEEAGLGIVRCRFENSPHVVTVREDRSEELVMEDCSVENVDQSLLLISEDANARTQINLLNVLCRNVPFIARYRAIPETVEGVGEAYRIRHFSHGLHINGIGQSPVIDTLLSIDSDSGQFAPPENPAREVPSNRSWVNVRDLGAIGDEAFDNTEILREAIRDYDTLYFPTGRYRVTDTIHLRESTCLVGMNPITTQIIIRDREPTFHPDGSLKAVIESANGGDAIIQGIGIDAGAINHRAVALKWKAGEHSLVNDVKFMGGHGTYDAEGNYRKIYNNNRSADSDIYRRWDSMPPSLWVTDNGGGSFKNLWTASPFAQAGMLVEKTSTPGWVYQLSSEHHLRNEVMFKRVKNWKTYAMQFEEESWEGRRTLPLLIQSSENLSFHNTYIYRVGRSFTPYLYGILLDGSDEIRFYGIHAYGPSKFTVDDTLYDQDSGYGVRSREIAYLEIPAKAAVNPDAEPGLELLADGFNHIDSPELDSRGNLYFVDAYNQLIYKWDPQTSELERVMDAAIEPSQILLENDNALLIFTRTGSLYRFPLNGGYGDLQLIEPLRGPVPSGGRYALPVTRWRDSHDFAEVTTEAKPWYFKFGDLFVPAESNYVEAGVFTSYFNTLDIERTYDLQVFSPGDEVYVSDEFAQKTWRFTLSKAGRPVDPTLFAEEGEAGVITDGEGRVYIAAGQIYVYSRSGERVRTIPVPDRPTALAISRSGKKQVLYILARTALYRLEL